MDQASRVGRLSGRAGLQAFGAVLHWCRCGHPPGQRSYCWGQWHGDKLHIGQLILNPEEQGETFGVADVRGALLNEARRHRALREVPYDPWSFRESAEILLERGLPMVEFPPECHSAQPRVGDALRAGHGAPSRPRRGAHHAWSGVIGGDRADRQRRLANLQAQEPRSRRSTRSSPSTTLPTRVSTAHAAKPSSTRALPGRLRRRPRSLTSPWTSWQLSRPALRPRPGPRRPRR